MLNRCKESKNLNERQAQHAKSRVQSKNVVSNGREVMCAEEGIEPRTLELRNTCT
ncbi:hypothetical protein AG1IA_04065 [Rhizoctonia solani AG-1 IA]|uniref:Uncharacterized protein n=1 Tax=Thanatephorus cucumeris (strain AG1-IA) TaxID=983506 RepID=L8WYS4_THACA|nr:hypothetical protein AG1IA_04065 [Rhizoctonia solani AG-1 IA]